MCANTAGLLSDAELTGMQEALDRLSADVASGEFAAAPEDEDEAGDEDDRPGDRSR